MNENEDSGSYGNASTGKAEMDYFSEYLKRGLPIIPIKRGEKKPHTKWKEFQETKPTKHQILSWYAKFDSAEWAVICGHDNLVCIDCDDPNIYHNHFSDFKGMVAKSPSGGINFFVKSNCIPNSSQAFCDYALDIRGSEGLANLPINNDREWINFGEPDEVDDIMKILKERLSPLTTKHRIDESCIDYIRGQPDIDIPYEGHGYVQILCPWHEETKASCTIYRNGFKCYGCGKKGGLFELIQGIEELSEEEILEKYKIEKPNDKGKGNITSKLVELIASKLKEDDQAQIIYDKNDNPLFWITVGDHFELAALSDRGFKNMVHQQFSDRYRTCLSDSNLRDAKGAIIACADKVTREKRLCPEMPLYARFIRGPDGEVVYDLGDTSWNCVRITSEGWSIRPQMLGFYRSRHQIAQMYPTRSENEFCGLEELMELFRLMGDNDQLLLKAWLCIAIINDIQHPVLWFIGGQGSGKSKQCEFIASIVDPRKSKKHKMPDKNRDLAVLLNSSRCVVFDNLNKPITDEQSDSLCMAVTGGSLEQRSLYENEESYLLNLGGTNILLNSHYVHRNAPDLIDRTLIFHVRPMEEDQILSENELDERYNRIKPEALGSIFASIANAMRILPEVREEAKEGKFKLGRMTDFTIWGEALARVWGYPKGRFAEAYSEKRTAQSLEILEDDPLAESIVGFAEQYWRKNGRNWTGSAQEMLEELEKYYKREIVSQQIYEMPDSWPKSPRALTARLSKIVVDLMRKGVIHTYGDKPKRIDNEVKRAHTLKWVIKESNNLEKATVTSENQELAAQAW